MSEAKPVTDEGLCEIRHQSDARCDPARTYSQTTVRSLVARIDAERKRAEEAEKKLRALPQTADGKPIILNENVYARVKMNDDPPAYSADLNDWPADLRPYAIKGAKP